MKITMIIIIEINIFSNFFHMFILHYFFQTGTNAVVKGHQQLTEEFVPRCDLVLFVTSAERGKNFKLKSFILLLLLLLLL